MTRDDRTAARAARLRAAGAMMCGPVPPTDADLDAVEEFLAWLKAGKAVPPTDADREGFLAWLKSGKVTGMAGTSARIRAVADPLIEHGYTPDMIYTAVMQALGLDIGRGAQGPDRTALYPGPLGDTPACPYCGAAGGGGHGGFCPTAARGA